MDLIKIFLAFLGSGLFSLVVAIVVLLTLKGIVYIFRLNYYQDTYWVLTATNYVWWITWLVTFGCFASIL